MAGYRSVFLRQARGVARLLPLPSLLKVSGQGLILPFYHLVSDQPPPHIRHLYPVRSIDRFREDLAFFLDHFQPIGPGDLQAGLAAGRSPDRPAFLLSFDDGFRECAEVVAPILQETGLTAVCFLNPAFLDNRALFFRCKASLLIDRIARDTGLEARAVNFLQERSFSGGSARELLLRISYADRHVLDQLAGTLGFSFSEYLDEQKPYLSSRQAEQLKAGGFHLGAHSLDHPLYAALTLEEQLRQTRESLAWIRSRFGATDRLFAFPFTDDGVSAAFFQRLYAEPAEMDLSFGTAGLKRDINPRHLQRIPMEVGSLSAREIVQGELLYHLLRAPFGKNQIRRA